MLARIIYWLARSLAIAFILFISLFALDAFSPEHPFWQNLLGFLIHMIPNFLLLIILVIAWKWERIGAILYTCMAIFAFFFFRGDLSVRIGFPLILLVIGSLFFWHAIRVKHSQQIL